MEGFRRKHRGGGFKSRALPAAGDRAWCRLSPPWASVCSPVKCRWPSGSSEWPGQERVTCSFWKEALGTQEGENMGGSPCKSTWAGPGTPQMTTSVLPPASASQAGHAPLYHH